MAIVAIQTGICAIERAGIVSCAGQSAAHDESSSETDGQSSPNHCCHALCHSSFVTTETMSVGFFHEPSAGFDTFQDIIPDGPVREIDYPPQLS